MKVTTLNGITTWKQNGKILQFDGQNFWYGNKHIINSLHSFVPSFQLSVLREFNLPIHYDQFVR